MKAAKRNEEEAPHVSKDLGRNARGAKNWIGTKKNNPERGGGGGGEK